MGSISSKINLEHYQIPTCSNKIFSIGNFGTIESLPSELLVHCFTFLTSVNIREGASLVNKRWHQVIRCCSFLNLNRCAIISLQIVTHNFQEKPWSTYLPSYLDCGELFYQSDALGFISQSDLVSISPTRFKLFTVVTTLASQGKDRSWFHTLEPCSIFLFQEDSNISVMRDGSVVDTFDISYPDQARRLTRYVLDTMAIEKQIILPKRLMSAYHFKLRESTCHNAADFFVSQLERHRNQDELPDWMDHNINVILSDIGFFGVNSTRLFKCLSRKWRSKYIEERLNSDLHSLRFFLLMKQIERTKHLSIVRSEFIICFLCGMHWDQHQVLRDMNSEASVKSQRPFNFTTEFFMLLLSSECYTWDLCRLVTHLMQLNQHSRFFRAIFLATYRYNIPESRFKGIVEAILTCNMKDHQRIVSEFLSLFNGCAELKEKNLLIEVVQKHLRRESVKKGSRSFLNLNKIASHS